MKKNIIDLAITAGILSFAMPSGLRAEDTTSTTTTTTDNGGACNGSCHKGDKKPDGDKGDKPAPAPTPAQ